MKTFLTLAEFLAMDDPAFGTGRPYNTHQTGQEWLELYNQAKLSWEMYGDDGPPVGSSVITLRAGFGGTRGKQLKFIGSLDSNNPNWFHLVGPNHLNSYSTEKIAQSSSTEISYIVHKNEWWRAFYVSK